MCRYYCTLMITFVDITALMITLCGYYCILMITLCGYYCILMIKSCRYYCILMITLCVDITAYLW